MVASFVHIWANDIQPDLIKAKEASSNAIKIRKSTHADLIDLNYKLADNKISLIEFNNSHEKLITDYREAKAAATLLINHQKTVANKYKINRFVGLEQFLYGLGLGVTIFFAGIVILLMAFKADSNDRKSGLFASTAVLSVGAFWISWALFQEGDYSKGIYYVVMLLVTSCIMVSVWHLLRSIESTNQKIRTMISFAMRARQSLFCYFDQQPSKAQHHNKDQYDDDFFETLDKLSK